MQNYIMHKALWDNVIEAVPEEGAVRKKNMKALTKMNINLDSKLFNHIRGVTQAADAWNYNFLKETSRFYKYILLLTNFSKMFLVCILRHE